jgi:hypothetical protein
LADIIERNSTTTNLQANVFFFHTSISGRVTAVVNGRVTGVSGVTIQLLDETGAVIATTTTAADGSYRFDQPGMGTYTVKEIAPNGTTPTRTVTLTRGQAITGIDFGDLIRRLPSGGCGDKTGPDSWMQGSNTWGLV